MVRCRPVPSLRVITLNVWGKQGPWEQRREILRKQLARLDPDLVGFQEIVRFDAAKMPATSGKSEEQVADITDGLGLHVAFGAAVELGSGFSFGNAIASRFPLEHVETHRLPNDHDAEHRALTTAIARTSFGPVLFGVTHLAWRFEEGALRVRQALVVAGEIERRHRGIEYPAILVGDFNAEPGSDEMRFLRGQHVADARATYFVDTFAEVGEGAGATYSHANDFARAVGEPERRIDYVLVRGRDGRGWGRPHAAKLAFDRAEAVADGLAPVYASDHFGLVVDLESPAFTRAARGNA